MLSIRFVLDKRSKLKIEFEYILHDMTESDIENQVLRCTERLMGRNVIADLQIEMRGIIC